MYRRNGMHRKKSGPDTDTILTEGISAIKDYLKEITDLQRRLVGSQEQIAKAQEAHADAMQQIADCVKTLLGKNSEPAPAPEADEIAEPVMEPFMEAATPRETSDRETPDEFAAGGFLPEDPAESDAAAEASSEAPLVESVLKVIAEMRENRISFEKIADRLEADGVPSLHGNGKWNRKTVSKFYKEAAI